MRDDYIPANDDCFVDNSKFCNLYLRFRLSTSNFHTFKFVHRFSQPTLHYTMISCNNTVNRKGADSETWKFIETSRNY